MFKSEWSYLVHHKMMLVVLVAIALIPAIYCFIYLSSMWDTYGKMDRIPVAIVDHDTPVTYHGKRIAIGQNLTTSLLKADALDFHHVSAATAEKRLRAGRYYMILTVPRGFSQKATTIMGENPQRMNLYFRFNSGQNFIVSKMTNGAATAIKAKVSAQVTKMYAGIVLSALGSARAGMQKAAAGGTQLAAGSKKLLAGETQLTSGTQAMDSGVGQLTAGNGKLASGNTAMASGFTRLTANTPKLTSGLSQIQSGLTQLAAKSPQLAQGTAQLSTLARTIQQQLTSGTANPTRLTAETTALTRGLQSLTAGSTASAQGSQQLLTGTAALTAGLMTYTQGVSTLAAGNRAIGTGLAAIQQNLPTLTAGTAQLTAGTTALQTGTTQLLKGSATLASSLTTGVQKLSILHTTTRNADALAVPIHEVTSDVAKIPNNGTGMAPFAIAIGLYVGGIALGTMYEGFLPHRKPRWALTWWASKASVVGLVGVLQTVLLYWSLTSATHLHVADQGLFFLVLLLGSWLFLSLIFCLRLLLGGFGTWLVSIVLVLQLAGAGGLYPTYLVNAFARSLNTWLPMTYLINALRSLISTHQSLSLDLWVITGLIIGFNLLMIGRFQIGLHQSVLAVIEDEAD